MDLFVTPDWLEANLADVVVLDASFYLPTMGKNADEEFQQAHVPGALRWNIDEIASADPAHEGLPHMMPSVDQIAEAAAERGIAPDTHVVVYDQIGVFSGPRLWFTLKLVGHKRVSLLAGGLPAWLAADKPTESGAMRSAAPKAYTPSAADSMFSLYDKDQVLANLETQAYSVADARPADRFYGKAPEPRAGLASGHIPGSCSLPFASLLSEGCLLPDDRLRAVLEASGVDLQKPVITTCGSGVSAAVLSMALWQLGCRSFLYDGSWSQWGDPKLGLPIG